MPQDMRVHLSQGLAHRGADGADQTAGTKTNKQLCCADLCLGFRASSWEQPRRMEGSTWGRGAVEQPRRLKGSVWERREFWVGAFFMTSLSSATAPTAKEKTGIGTQSGQEGGSIGGLLMCQANHPAYRQHPGLKVTAGKPCFSGFSSSQD